jgi:phosphoglycerate transporter family protein
MDATALAGPLARAFRPPPAATPLTDPAEVARRYRRLRVQLLAATFGGYALFYLCRKNISIAMPALGRDLGYTNVQLGLLGTLLYVTYGVGKFVNGIIGDHVNPRLFMALGLALSALASVAFGLAGSLWALAALWALNGWFQSMGFPPCARILAHWFSVSERGFSWSLWNISHQVGAGVIALLAGWLIGHWGWRSAFTVPGAICLAGAVVVWLTLRDTPASEGLPPIARFRDDPELEKDGRELTDAPETVQQILFGRVLNNPHVWLISLFNLFVYVVRSGTFDWAAKFLVEHKGSSIGGAGAISATFELAGVAGAMLAGVLSDKLGRGKRAPVCGAWMLLSALGIALFWWVPRGHPLADGACLALIGFAVYGPQFLLAVFVTDLASPKAAATAIGLTGVFGYAGSALSGVGTGYCIDRFGWGGAFAFWGAMALAGALLALPLWNVRARRPGDLAEAA